MSQQSPANFIYSHSLSKYNSNIFCPGEILYWLLHLVCTVMNAFVWTAKQIFLAFVYHLRIRLGYPGNGRVIGVGIGMNHINDTFGKIQCICSSSIRSNGRDCRTAYEHLAQRLFD